MVDLKNFGPSNDSCDIRCAKKGVIKSFQCSKAMDQCGESYKTLFTKDFSHICLHYHIKITIPILPSTNTLQTFIPYFLPKEKFQ
jgi:hypothetical protein